MFCKPPLLHFQYKSYLSKVIGLKVVHPCSYLYTLTRYSGCKHGSMALLHGTGWRDESFTSRLRFLGHPVSSHLDSDGSLETACQLKKNKNINLWLFFIKTTDGMYQWGSCFWIKFLIGSVSLEANAALTVFKAFVHVGVWEQILNCTFFLLSHALCSQKHCSDIVQWTFEDFRCGCCSG